MTAAQRSPRIDRMAPFAKRPGWLRWLLLAGLGLLVLFVLAQAVPYGRSHTNPPVTKEPAWDSPRTRALAARACFDCHSNETKWLWYSNVAPVSWLVQRDVDGGRSALNFSEWDKPQDASAGDIAEAVRGGGMPPWFYTIIHRNAALSGAEKNDLIAGLNATLAKSPPLGGGG
jgi:mono/diheme cytochrome c family protein